MGFFSFRFELHFQLWEAFPDDLPHVEAAWETLGASDLRDVVKRLSRAAGTPAGPTAAKVLRPSGCVGGGNVYQALSK